MRELSLLKGTVSIKNLHFGICISVPEASRAASSSSFQAPLPVCAAGWPHFLYGQGRSSFSLSASVFFPPLTRRVIFGMQKAAGNCLRLFLEVPTRFELVHRGFADLCLTTWLYRHERIKSSKIGVAGFEPAHHGIKTRCLTAWLYPSN